MRTRISPLFAAVVVVCVVGAPRSASAQQDEAWQFTLAPFYLWAMETNGTVTARSVSVPVFLDFADAADHLSGAFSFHFEAHKNRWGGFADVNFVSLQSESSFTVQPIEVLPPRTIEGDLSADIEFVEAGASYLVHVPSKAALIAGMRTYTLSSELEFSGADASISLIDASRTSVNGFIGVTLRPALSAKWNLVSRADIGGGGAELTWSAMAGVEFRPRPRFGLILGYKALGIDAGEDEGVALREYDMTHYGPIFGLNLHWGRN